MTILRVGVRRLLLEKHCGEQSLKVSQLISESLVNGSLVRCLENV